MLQEIIISNFKNSAGTVQDICVTYQFFGSRERDAPVVLVTHALTGNSEVTGTNGWWKEIVGEGKCIDTCYYSVLAFNMPGNGFRGRQLLENYQDFTLHDIARIYELALGQLEISTIFAGIGGSIGGALLWELAALKPDLFENLIPVAADFKATHWLKALCKVQDRILNNSVEPLQDARMHAMIFYRSPQSFLDKFGADHKGETGDRNIEGWLEYHGEKLAERFELGSYKLMNHLLTTLDISRGTGDHLSAAAIIKSNIHIITVNSDRFFLPEENWQAYVNLSLTKENIRISEIRSIHGHDAFLIENSQLSSFLKPIFNSKSHKNEKNKHSALWSG